MERVEIASLYKATPADGTKVTVCGWAKTVRDSKKIGFISLADGSCYKPVQIVFQADKLEKLHFLLHTSPKRTALFWLIFTVPGTPKDLLCYFAGLTDLPWGTWLLIATVGRLPSIVTSTVGGSALGEQNYRAAVIAFALALAVAGVGYVIYRAVCRRHGQKPDNTKTDG